MKMINEYSAKFINDIVIRWKNENPKATEDLSKKLIKRFEEIQKGLTQKLNILSLSDELKKDENYLNIDKYSFDDIVKLIKSYPESLDKIKKDAIKLFVDKAGIDRNTAQSYVARFMNKREVLKYATENGLEDIGFEKEDILNLIPKRIQQNNLFYDPRNWDWVSFEQMLDAVFPSQKTVDGDDDNLATTDADKIYSENGIEIYKGDDINKCISYNPIEKTKKRKYGWCVTQPGNTNYDFYRFEERSPTFYFVFDRNKPSTPEHAPFRDQWHAFVIQINKQDNSYIITGADNRGDIKAKTWEDISEIVPSDTWNKIKNLKKYFIPINLSPIELARKFSSGKNLSLDEFKELSQEEKILYVQGKASKQSLSKDILSILPNYRINLEGRTTTLANVAIDSGQTFTYNILKDNEALAKRYAIFRFRHTNYSKDPIPLPFVKYLDEEAKQKYLKTFEDNLSFELIDKYFGVDTLKQAINEQANLLGYIPEYLIRYIKDNKLKSLYEVYSKLYDSWSFDSNYNNEELINNSFEMPEQIVTPSLILYKDWIKMSREEREQIIELINKLDEDEKYLSFLYAAPYIIKDGNNEYVLLPKEKNEYGYDNWVLIDKDNKIIKNNISGENSFIGNIPLHSGYFSYGEPKRIYNIEDCVFDENINETLSLYKNWDKYQFMLKAGIIK
jgi:hypothetical protein